MKKKLQEKLSSKPTDEFESFNPITDGGNADQYIPDEPEVKPVAKKKAKKEKSKGPKKPVNNVRKNAPSIGFATVVELRPNKEHEIRAYDMSTNQDVTASIYFSVRKKAYAKGAKLIRLRDSWKQLTDDMLEAVQVYLSNKNVPENKELVVA